MHDLEVQRPHATKCRRRARNAYGALAVLAIAAPLVYLVTWSYKWGLDLEVYRGGSGALFRGHDPYRELFTVHRLPYSYPPPALLILAPLDVLPFLLSRLLWWGASAACVAFAIWAVLRKKPGRGRNRLDVLVYTGAACILLEPVRNSLDYGQVNAVLMVLVIADVLVVGRYRGVGVGVAAAVKLTPLFFVAFFVANRDWRAVGRMVSTFALLTGVAWIAFPRASTDYWVHQVLNPSRPGDPAFVGNQSLLGALDRLPVSSGIAHGLWVVASVVVVAAVIFVARHALTYGAPVAALFIVAIGACLISPIAWSHHWIWICLVPAMAASDAYHRLPWGPVARSAPWFLIAVGVLGTYWWDLPAPVGTFTDDGLVIAGLVVLAAWVIAAMPSIRALHPQGSSDFKLPALDSTAAGAA